MYWIARFRITVIILSFILIPGVCAAGTIDVSGYASLIGTKTDDKDITYLNEYATNYVDFSHESLIGIQFNTEINKELEFSVTLQGKGRDDYQAQFPWFYATYNISKNTVFQFGRLKIPFYMISDYIDIGHAYPWV